MAESGRWPVGDCLQDPRVMELIDRLERHELVYVQASPWVAYASHLRFVDPDDGFDEGSHTTRRRSPGQRRDSGLVLGVRWSEWICIGSYDRSAGRGHRGGPP